MDLFEFPDDYKPQKPLTDQEFQQINNYIKGHPLFLKELPEDMTTNQHLFALKQIVQQTPQEAALNLNKNANKRLAQGPNSPYYMKDAYQKYTQAIKLKCQNAELNAKLHCNRASINLKYKNYGKVIQDCKMSLKYDPKYQKAYFRLGKAYIALKKYDQCIDLLSDQNNEQLKLLHEQAQKLKSKQTQYKTKIQIKQSSEQNQIQKYCLSKKWKLKKRNQQLPEGVEIKFINNKISIPIIVIYPQFNQFDLIAQTTQQQKISTALQQLFSMPLPWDQKKQYHFKQIQIYTQIQQGILLKLPKQATVEEIALRTPIKGAIQIFIIVNNKFSQYFKSQYKIY